MRHFVRITFCILVLFFGLIALTGAQRKRTHRQPILPIEKKSITQIADTTDIVETTETYYYELVLKNFPVGEVTHRSRELFIQKIISKIQELRVNKNIVSVVIVGWADGLVNPGIPKGNLKLGGECAKQCSATVYDKELAKLRACEIQRSLSSGIISHSIELDDKIDSHDEKDHQNIGGLYRKVVVKIFI